MEKTKVAIVITEDGRSLIEGLHHVTGLVSDVHANNRFFSHFLGLRRVKQTVNHDAPDVYHLYYGDRFGHAGTVMTSLAFPRLRRGRLGAGSVSSVAFAVQSGALSFWKKRLEHFGLKRIRQYKRFEEDRIAFSGMEGESLEVVEMEANHRQPWKVKDIPADSAIRGLHSVSMCLADHTPMAELLVFLGYEETKRESSRRRFQIVYGNGADIIDLETDNTIKPAVQGAGSVHHIAFAVANREALLILREALLDAGYSVTPVIDRTYFLSVYFRVPGGVLLEVSTNDPGFTRDEDVAHLGKSLKLPKQLQHLQDYLARNLEPLQD